MLTLWNELGWAPSGWGSLRHADLDRHFSTLNDLRQEMDRLFNDFERGRGATELPALGRSAWPRVSIHDAGPALRLWAEVPGLTEQELDITVQQNSVTIRGQRRAEAPDGYSVHRQERGALTFARSFTLPCRVDAEQVNATLKHGILELTLPKIPEAQPKQIQVQTA